MSEPTLFDLSNRMAPGLRPDGRRTWTKRPTPADDPARPTAGNAPADDRPRLSLKAENVYRRLLLGPARTSELLRPEIGGAKYTDRISEVRAWLKRWKGQTVGARKVEAGEWEYGIEEYK
jgi:hypothetical protein